MSTTNPKIVIIGGSLAGLTLALACAVRGIPVVIVEGKVKSPFVPITLFKRRITGGANLVSLLANTALGPTCVIITLFMQEILSFSATQTGLGLLPMASAFTLASACLGTWMITKTVILI